MTDVKAKNPKREIKALMDEQLTLRLNVGEAMALPESIRVVAEYLEEHPDLQIMRVVNEDQASGGSAPNVSLQFSGEVASLHCMRQSEI